jgi:hypothetical protein
MVAAKLANMARGDNQHASIEATSQSAAAELLNISRRSSGPRQYRLKVLLNLLLLSRRARSQYPLLRTSQP